MMKVLIFLLIVVSTTYARAISFSIDVYSKNNFQTSTSLYIQPNNLNTIINNTYLLKSLTSKSTKVYGLSFYNIYPWYNITSAESIASLIESKDFELENAYNYNENSVYVPQVQFGLSYQKKQISLNPYIAIEDLMGSLPLPPGYSIESPAVGILIPITISDNTITLALEKQQVISQEITVLTTYGFSFEPRFKKTSLLISYENSKNGSYIYNTMTNSATNLFINSLSNVVYYSIGLKQDILSNLSMAVGYKHVDSNIEMKTEYINFLINSRNTSFGIEYNQTQINTLNYPNIFLMVSTKF